MWILILLAILVLLGLAAPIQMAANQKTLGAMEALVRDYERINFEAQGLDREYTKRDLKRKLSKMKSRILADRRSTDLATDLINSF